MALRQICSSQWRQATKASPDAAILLQHWKWRVRQQLLRMQSQRLEAQQRLVSLQQQREEQEEAEAPLAAPAQQQLEVARGQVEGS